MANPILLYTEIYPAVAEAFTEKVLDTPKDETIYTWINGPGGSLSAGWSMLAVLNDRDVNMTVTGDASSFYFYMLMFANHVTAFDTSNFLIHRAGSMWESMMSEDQLKEVESRNKIIRKKLEARIDEDKFKKVTGKTFDDIFSMDGYLDVRLTAKEAKKIGLVDKVIKLDVKKRTEIESRYFNDIAALATPNTNSNSNKMGILSKAFGKDDPVLLATINDSQFAYSKLEKGELIKAIGEGDHKPISGTFEAKDKTITVVDNKITAVEDIDNKQIQLDKLTEQVTALSEAVSKIGEKEPKKDVAEDENQKRINALTKQITDLTAVLDKAKITKSDPDLPAGEFKDDIEIEDERDLREKLVAQQNESHEAKIKSRGA